MAVSLKDDRYRWVALALYALTAFLVAVALVFGARWVYRSIHHPNNPSVKQPSSTYKKPQPTAPKKSSSRTQSQSKPSSKGTASLPNNGPGDVVALFIGTSAIAAGLHYFVQSRRLLS